MENTNLIISNTVKLNNGYEMPRVGLGTYKTNYVCNVVYQSIKDGLRMIDTSSIYENEKEIGLGINQAINEGIVKREEMFIVTKLWVNHKHFPEEAIKTQLKELNLDYVDLYLDHWPITTYKCDDKLISTPTHVLWSNMEDLVAKGYTRSIGVSNYNVQMLMDLLSYCKIKPVTNQVEFHPYLYQKNLVKYCLDNDIYVTAYNSLRKGAYVKRNNSINLDLLSEPIIQELAQKYEKSAGLICLNWALIQDVLVIPATSNPDRMKENLQATSFRLSEEDFEKINKLNINFRLLRTFSHPFSLGADMFA